MKKEKNVAGVVYFTVSGGCFKKGTVVGYLLIGSRNSPTPGVAVFVEINIEIDWQAVGPNGWSFLHC